MLKQISKFFLLTFLFFQSFNIFCGMIDNRYLPLYRQMYTRYCDRRSIFGSNIFSLFSHEGLNNDGRDIPLPEINGKYDLIRITKALELIGKPNPLKTEWRSFAKLELDMEGKLEGQGWWLGYEQAISQNFSLGVSWYLLNVVSRQQFIIPDTIKKELKLNKGTENIFDKELREANELLGIKSNQFKKTAFSDLDLYLRFGTVKEYVHKFRRVDAGINFGCLFPSGPTIELNDPSSIPFGGNGHYGLYALAELNLELKEDLLVGLWFEVLKRLPKIEERRIPINGEPFEFGAAIGKVKINPGITVGFSPYVAFSDIRDGFGFKLRYTLIFHDEDEWCHPKLDTNIKLKNTIVDSLNKTEWTNEYLTFTLMYDFSKSIKYRKFAPIIYLEWDRPTRIFMANQVSKTNRVSFGFEFSF